ncbi:MAG: ABC transporter permease, partial [Chloroflexota bacterium]
MSAAAVLPEPGARQPGLPVGLGSRFVSLWRTDSVRLGSLAGFLVLWQLSGFVLDPILISTPTSIISGFVAIMSDGSLETAFLQSLGDMIVGFGLASMCGIGLGVFMGRYTSWQAIFNPYVSVMNATPTIALLPLMIMWFGFGLWGRVAFIFVVSLWTLVINTMVGMKSVKHGYVEAGLAFGLSERQLLWKVILPAAVPYI